LAKVLFQLYINRLSSLQQQLCLSYSLSVQTGIKVKVILFYISFYNSAMSDSTYHFEKSFICKIRNHGCSYIIPFAEYGNSP